MVASGLSVRWLAIRPSIHTSRVFGDPTRFLNWWQNPHFKLDFLTKYVVEILLLYFLVEFGTNSTYLRGVFLNTIYNSVGGGGRFFLGGGLSDYLR